MTANPDEELKGLLDQFVRVRRVQMGGVDLETFQFDPLLSWSLFFMNADKTIYGRFGTASPNAKLNRKDSNPNHTVAGLKAALRGALRLHKSYTAKPAAWRDALAGKTGPKPAWRRPEQMPSAKKYKRKGRVRADTKKCFHCHEVQRSLIDSTFMAGKKVTDAMLWMYPNASVLGLTLSKDHPARIVRVAPKSIAAQAGLQPGDDLEAMHGQPLLSVADVIWVLHTFPDAGGKLALRVKRGDKHTEVGLTLPKHWRRNGDFGWRYRVAGYAMWLWAGVTFADSPRGVRVANRSPWWFKKTNRSGFNALQRGDVILSVDGRKDWTRSRLLAYLMREKKLGAIVKLQVLRRGQSVDVRFSIPKKRPEVQGH